MNHGKYLFFMENVKNNKHEWFTLDEIELLDNDTEDLYCLEVDSPDHEFLVGKTLTPTHNTDDAKAAQALKGDASSKIGSIARLGRAAGVHLMIATQRPDAKLISGELKSNLGARFACGQMQSTASSMVLENNEATRTPGNPKGRAIIKIYGTQERMQVYWATQDWIDKWLKRRGLNQDGSPIDPSVMGTPASSPDNIDLASMAAQATNDDSTSSDSQDSIIPEMNPIVAEDMGDDFADKLTKMREDSLNNAKSSNTDEWHDYGNFMDNFMAAGDDPDSDQ